MRKKNWRVGDIEKRQSRYKRYWWDITKNIDVFIGASSNLQHTVLKFCWAGGSHVLCGSVYNWSLELLPNKLIARLHRQGQTERLYTHFVVDGGMDQTVTGGTEQKLMYKIH